MQPVPRDNLSARVYKQLRAALMRGHYEPGQRLTINELAAEMGTSATPVREALFRLVAEGGLDIQEAQSFRIPRLTKVQVAELQTIRMLLEGEAAAVAATKARPDKIKELAVINDAFMAALRDGKVEEASELNRQFHFGVVALAEMPLLLSTVEVMWARMGALIHRVNISRRRRGTYGLDHEHYAVLEGLRTNRADLARRAIENDIKSGRLVVDEPMEDAEASTMPPTTMSSLTVA